jgi:hypothetical protein
MPPQELFSAASRARMLVYGRSLFRYHCSIELSTTISRYNAETNIEPKLLKRTFYPIAVVKRGRQTLESIHQGWLCNHVYAATFINQET